MQGRSPARGRKGRGSRPRPLASVRLRRTTTITCGFSSRCTTRCTRTASGGWSRAASSSTRREGSPLAEPLPILIANRATRTFGYGFVSVLLAIYLKLLGGDEAIVVASLRVSLATGAILNILAR